MNVEGKTHIIQHMIDILFLYVNYASIERKRQDIM